MSLATRAVAEEQMDAAELDPATYARVLTDLGQVNRLLLTARPTLAFVARAVGDRERFSLLDVGFGDGGMLRAIARWAERRGKTATLVGVDLNPKSAAVARAATPPGLAIEWRTGDYARLGAFDLVVSSLVTHHMSAAELLAFVRWQEANARLGWMVNDLHRHGFAYRAFPLLARAMGWHRIVREDGTLSVARSFRPPEWQAILSEAGVRGTRVVRRFPFKLCVERTR